MTGAAPGEADLGQAILEPRKASRTLYNQRTGPAPSLLHCRTSTTNATHMPRFCTPEISVRREIEGLMITICMDCEDICRQTLAASNDGAHLGENAPQLSHGLCIRCYAIRAGAIETDELNSWVDRDINHLPTGKIVLDSQLRVIG